MTSERSARVGDAVLRRPKVLSADATVADVREQLADDHVHAALIADGPILLTVVARTDLAELGPEVLARDLGTLEGRTAHPDDDLEATRLAMLRTGARRLAVIDDAGALVGLLALKRSGTGFCTPEGVEARAAERDAAADD